MQTVLDILSSLGFNWHVALANFVNFLIILYILNRYVFTKIGDTLAKREEIIRKGLHDAREAALVKQEAEADKDHIISMAEKEAKTIVADSHNKAKAVALSMTDEAHKEAASIVKEAIAKKEDATALAYKEFNDLAPRLVAQLTEKALRSKMTKELNDTMITSIV
jgi:F-type H+-transporting ATPase subunit b